MNRSGRIVYWTVYIGYRPTGNVFPQVQFDVVSLFPPNFEQIKAIFEEENKGCFLYSARWKDDSRWRVWKIEKHSMRLLN